MRPINTFSIVAYDAGREEWGVAVQSKFLAVGSVVPWARAGAGAVATQSYANVMYGPEGLRMMGDGTSAEETISALVESDPDKSLRQVGVVDREGTAAAFTGDGCYDWAGHIVGDGFTCQGNILLPGTVEAMADEFEKVRGGEGELSDWLVQALLAGQEAGGDKRGRQSAAVLVVRQGGGYGGNHDRYLDLRVDDDQQPIRELQKLLQMHHLYFQEGDPEDLVPLADVSSELQELLKETGDYDGSLSGQFDEETRQALRALIGRENLEERWDHESDEIDRNIISFLIEKYSK